MIGDRLRFSPDELPIEGGRVAASAITVSLAVAHGLEAFLLAPTPAPSPAFATRVMAAIAAEPAPQPVSAFAQALAGGRFRAMLAALRDAWRVSTSAGRPARVRAQALALVLLALLAFGSLAGIAGAAVGLFESRQPSPPPLPTRPAVVPPSPVTRPADDVSPLPTPTGSPELTESPQPSATASPTARPTPRPIATPRRTASPRPTESDEGGVSETPDADDSPSPSDGTPRPSDHSGPG